MTDIPYTAQPSRARLLRFLVPVLTLHGLLLAILPDWQGQPPADRHGVAVRLAPIAAPQPAAEHSPPVRPSVTQPPPAEPAPAHPAIRATAPHGAGVPVVAGDTPSRHAPPEPGTTADPVPTEPTKATTARTASPPAVAAAPPEPAPQAIQDKPHATASVTSPATTDWRSRYRSELRNALASYLHYPPRARRFGLSGEVTVGFSIERDGHFAHIHLAHSSDADLLDQAALDTVRRLGRFRPLPAGYSEDSWEVEVPLVYRLD